MYIACMYRKASDLKRPYLTPSICVMPYNLPPCCYRIVRDCLTFAERGRFMLTARAPAVDLERCMMELYLLHLFGFPSAEPSDL